MQRTVQKQLVEKLQRYFTGLYSRQTAISLVLGRNEHIVLSLPNTLRSEVRPRWHCTE